MIKRSSSKQQTQDQFLSYYVINRVFISKDVFSNTRQPHVEFLLSWAVAVPKFSATLFA